MVEHSRAEYLSLSWTVSFARGREILLMLRTQIFRDCRCSRGLGSCSSHQKGPRQSPKGFYTALPGPMRVVGAIRQTCGKDCHDADLSGKGGNENLRFGALYREWEIIARDGPVQDGALPPRKSRRPGRRTTYIK